MTVPSLKMRHLSQLNICFAALAVFALLGLSVFVVLGSRSVYIAGESYAAIARKTENGQNLMRALRLRGSGQKN